MKRKEKVIREHGKRHAKADPEPLCETQDAPTQEEPEQTADEPQTILVELCGQTNAAGKLRRLLPKRRHEKKAHQKGEALQRIRRGIGENRTTAKRVAVAAVALTMIANIVMTSVFVAYSVRTRRQSESDYYSNYWEIDDLRTEMENNSESFTQDMDQWKTNESIFSGTIGYNLTWEIDPETAELSIHGSGNMECTFDENRHPAFGMLYSGFVRSVVLDDNVNDVAPYAFSDFTALTSVRLGEHTEVIGEHAFDGCTALEEVETQSGLKKIKYDAFYGCESLHSLSLPGGFESYETANSQSTDIWFTVENGGEYSSDANGCLYTDKGKTLVSCPVGAGYDYCGNPENWDVPKSVTAIDDGCFIGGMFNRLTIPGSVKSLDLAAFGDCGVRKLTLKDGVQSVVGTPGEYVYLDTVVLPSSVTRVEQTLFDAGIGDMQFSGKPSTFWVDQNGLVYSADKKELLFVPRADERESLSVAEGTQRIRANATGDICDLKSLSLPDSLKAIGDHNFNALCLEKGETLKLPAHLKTIGDDCLRFCRVSKITIPSSVTSIGSSFLYETDDGRYDEEKDQYIENPTKVTFDGTENKWNSLFEDESDAPTNVKMDFAG